MTRTHTVKRPPNAIPLEQCHLYGLGSPQVLAERLGWDLPTLEALTTDGRYRVFEIAGKKSKRMIQEPGGALQNLHRQLHRYLSRVRVPDYLHSVVKRRSYLTNASSHIGPGALFTLDLAKFYPSVPQHRIMHFFRDELRCAPDVAGLLANLICYEGHLPTGSAISPIISFFACRDVFEELAALARRHGLRMTCYIDDVAFSGPAASSAVVRKAEWIISRAGFTPHKKRFYPAGTPRLVTGVVVTATGLELPKSRWQRIKRSVRDYEAAPTPSAKLEHVGPLLSRLYEAAQIDPRCRRMADHYNLERRRLSQLPNVDGAASVALSASRNS